MRLRKTLKTTNMKVHFTFHNNYSDGDTTFKVFDNWEHPLPNIGDFIASDDNSRNGSVSRIEWNLDTPNEVYIID